MTDIIDAEGAMDERPTSGRRDLLGKAAIAAAVTTVAGLSMSKTASAGAGNGVNMTQGAANTGASNTTSLAGGGTFHVINGSTVGITGTNARQGSIYGQTSAFEDVGVLGFASGTDGWGVYGKSTGSAGIGVYGLATATSAVGIMGEYIGTAGGTGIVGKSNGGTGVSASSTSGVGLLASGTTFDVQASGTGRVLISANGVANPPSGSSTVGTIAKDSAGNHWVCVASGSPGTWRKLAGPATAGAFHALTPSRVYDSRAAAPAPGTLSSGGNRTISVANSRNEAGTVVTTDFVPAGATAVAANITITNTVNSGFLTVNPGGTVTTLSSTINWFGTGQNLANGVTLTLNTNRELTIVAGGGGICDFIVDISGYYL
jgi:hypothetical protein